MEDNVDRVEVKRIVEEDTDIIIDSMTPEQAKNALKYLNHRTHTKDGTVVLLVFDHNMVNFEFGENKYLGGFDCFSHTFADAIESVGIDLNEN
jgi:hypothetical protein